MTNLDKQIAQTLKNVAGELDQPSFVIPDQVVAYKRKRSRLLGTLVLPVLISCALLLTISVSPTFAAYVKSLFNGSDKELQYAAQEGFSQKVNASVTDRGYTLEIEEILADPMRIVAVYSIKDQQKNFIHPDKLHISNVEVTDLKGNVIKETKTYMVEIQENYGYLTLKKPGKQKNKTFYYSSRGIRSTLLKEIGP